MVLDIIAAAILPAIPQAMDMPMKSTQLTTTTVMRPGLATLVGNTTHQTAGTTLTMARHTNDYYVASNYYNYPTAAYYHAPYYNYYDYSSQYYSPGFSVSMRW